MNTTTLITKSSQGEDFELIRYQPDGADCPMDLFNYFLTSFVLNNSSPGADLGYWLADLQARFKGKYCGVSSDYFYGIKISGTWAARLWFGYSLNHRLGNFGHVCTEKMFRRRGLLNCLLEQFVADFALSSARCVGCSTNNPIAAKSYIAHGFQLPYGGEFGPLFYGEDFLTWSQNSYTGRGITQIREADFGDQFCCDKFLAYSPDVYHHSEFQPCIYSDIRTALLEQQRQQALVCVADNENNLPIGYVVIKFIGNTSIMDCVIHPAYRCYETLLHEESCKIFQEKFPDRQVPLKIR